MVRPLLRSKCLVASLLCALIPVEAAVAPVYNLLVTEHPDNVIGSPTSYDANFNTQLLREDMAVIHDNVFSDAAMQQMAREGAVLDAYSRRTRRTPSGEEIKTHAWWLDFEHFRGEVDDDRSSVLGGAGFGIERAIVHMLHLDYPGIAERRRVAGAEWWIKIQQSPQMTQTLHFDKDESRNRDGYGLRCPMESTVTYLTTGGSPTLIVNRTSPDGIATLPLVPLRAVLVYPVPGRHLLFRANLQHGIMGDLASEYSYSDLNLSHLSQGVLDTEAHVSRYTLMVNFWDAKPGAPECQRVSLGAQLALLAMEEQHGNKSLVGLDHHRRGTTRPLKRVVFEPGKRSSRHTLDLYFRQADLFQFELPSTFDRAALEGWDVTWERWQVQGGWGPFDMDNPQFSNWWETSLDMKLLVFSDEGMKEKIAREVLPALAPFREYLKVVLADPTRDAVELKEFKTTTTEALRLNSQGDAVVVAIRGQNCCGAKWHTMSGHLSGQGIAEFARAFISAAIEDKRKTGSPVSSEL